MAPRTVRARRPAMYNTPAIRTGGMGALQVEAVTNRPASIQRRHLAASQLRMRDIEPDELSSSEWCAFLVMETHERDRWIGDFTRRRRQSTSSSSSSSSSSADNSDRERNSYSKAEEARAESRRSATPVASTPTPAPMVRSATTGGSTPFVSLWVRHLEQLEQPDTAGSRASEYNVRRPRHTRRSVDTLDAPPTYDIAVRSGSPPPAYEPRSDDEGSSRSRIRRWADSHLRP
jgi:hypothetical protein